MEQPQVLRLLCQPSQGLKPWRHMPSFFGFKRFATSRGYETFENRSTHQRLQKKRFRKAQFWTWEYHYHRRERGQDYSLGRSCLARSCTTVCDNEKPVTVGIGDTYSSNVNVPWRAKISALYAPLVEGIASALARAPTTPGQYQKIGVIVALSNNCPIMALSNRCRFSEPGGDGSGHASELFL